MKPFSCFLPSRHPSHESDIVRSAKQTANYLLAKRIQIISTICAYIERSKKHPLENVVQQEDLKADCLNGCFENA